MVDVERKNYSILFWTLITVKNGQFSKKNSSHSDSTSNRLLNYPFLVDLVRQALLLSEKLFDSVLTVNNGRNWPMSAKKFPRAVFWPFITAKNGRLLKKQFSTQFRPLITAQIGRLQKKNFSTSVRPLITAKNGRFPQKKNSKSTLTVNRPLDDPFWSIWFAG